MRKLCDVPFSELKIGDKCISALGTPGKIIELLPEPLDRYDSISIEWENGKQSLYAFHMVLDKVEYIGE